MELFNRSNEILGRTNILDDHLKRLVDRVSKLDDRVSKLEYGLRNLCQHKILNLANVETYESDKGYNWITGLKCEICGKIFTKKPKGSKVKTTIEKLV